jgi:uncharacterized protein YukE
MAFKKRSSLILTDAQKRASALASIDAALDLGGGLTLQAFNQQVASLQAKLDEYNTALSRVDELGNQVKAQEKKVQDLNERMLAGVAAKYGRDSDEYEKAGGTRKSERKRPVRKPKKSSS